MGTDLVSACRTQKILFDFEIPNDWFLGSVWAFSIALSQRIKF